MPGGACGAAETQHAHTTTQPMTAMRTQPSGRTAFILDLAQIPLALFDGPFANLSRAAVYPVQIMWTIDSCLVKPRGGWVVMVLQASWWATAPSPSLSAGS